MNLMISKASLKSYQPLFFLSRFRLLNRGQSTIPNEPASSPTKRLSQIVASIGICSRTQAENWIKARRVTLNGTIVTSPFFKVTEEDKVTIDGLSVSTVVPPPSPADNKFIPRLWMVHKRAGELVAVTDSKKRPLLLPRLQHLLGPTRVGKKSRKSTVKDDIKPVLRLDFQVEGLCLVTNSGILARHLGGTRSGLMKHYRIRLHGLITDSKLQGLARGVSIKGRKYLPMQVTVERTSGTISWVKIVTAEPCSRDIKVYLQHFHYTIARMILVGLGPYQLRELPPGGVEELTITPEVFKIYRGKGY